MSNLNKRKQAKDKNTEKYSDAEAYFKYMIRKIRLDNGWTMDEAAQLVGCSRKKLEDMETLRGYGCYIGLDDVHTWAEAYNVEPAELVGKLSVKEAKDFFYATRHVSPHYTA